MTSRAVTLQYNVAIYNSFLDPLLGDSSIPVFVAESLKGDRRRFIRTSSDIFKSSPTQPHTYRSHKHELCTGFTSPSNSQDEDLANQLCPDLLQRATQHHNTMRSKTASCLLGAACLLQIGNAASFAAAGLATSRRDEEWSVTPAMINASIDAMNTAWYVKHPEKLFSS